MLNVTRLKRGCYLVQTMGSTSERLLIVTFRLTPYMPKKRDPLLTWLLLVALFAGSWRSQGAHGAYYERLDRHRSSWKVVEVRPRQAVLPKPKPKSSPVAPVHDVTAQLDDLLARRRLAKAQIDAVQGYTVQVYKGDRRDLAFKTRNKLYTHYPHIAAEIQYEAPYYVVYVGKFIDKIEAYSTYMPLKKYLKQAIIRPMSLANKPDSFSNAWVAPAEAPEEEQSAMPAEETMHQDQE